MSKSKKSKLFASMLCATVVAGLYAAPVMAADTGLTVGTEGKVVADSTVVINGVILAGNDVVATDGTFAGTVSAKQITVGGATLTSTNVNKVNNLFDQNADSKSQIYAGNNSHIGGVTFNNGAVTGVTNLTATGTITGNAITANGKLTAKGGSSITATATSGNTATSTVATTGVTNKYEGKNASSNTVTASSGVALASITDKFTVKDSDENLVSETSRVMNQSGITDSFKDASGTHTAVTNAKGTTFGGTATTGTTVINGGSITTNSITVGGMTIQKGAAANTVEIGGITLKKDTTTGGLAVDALDIENVSLNKNGFKLDAANAANGFAVEGTTGSLNVKDINGESTMVYTKAADGKNTMWLDTATGRLSTVGTVSVGGELGGQAKTVIDGDTGNIAVGVTGDKTQMIHLSAETGSITAHDFNGVELATDGKQVLVGGVDVAALEKTLGYTNDNVKGITRDGEVTNIEGVVDINRNGYLSVVDTDYNSVFKVTRDGVIDAKVVGDKGAFNIGYDDVNLKYADNGMSADANGTVLTGGTTTVTVDDNGTTFSNGEATTVINGNEITTGAINANKLSAQDITAEKANIGNGLLSVGDGTITALNGAVQMGTGTAGAYVKVGEGITFYANSGNIAANSFNNVTIEKSNGNAIINGVNINSLDETVGGIVDSGLPEKVGGIERDGEGAPGEGVTTIEGTLSVSKDFINARIAKSIFSISDEDVTIAHGSNGVVINNMGVHLSGNVNFDGGNVYFNGGNVYFDGNDGNSYTLADLEDRVSDLEYKTQNINGAGSTEGSEGGAPGTDKGHTGITGDVTVGGDITTGDTTITGDGITTDSVTADSGNFSNQVTVGEGENQTTITGAGITTGNVTAGSATIGNVQIGDSVAVGNTEVADGKVTVGGENGKVEITDNDVTIYDKEGNESASIQGNADAIAGIQQDMGAMSNRISQVEDRIDKVGAMSAAIANLRTMGYDPAAPTEIAVGLGQYRSETGAALGLFHYPNKDFMLSLSVSTSGDEVMGGIGATWKFGRKTPAEMKEAEAKKAEARKIAKAKKAEEMKLAAAEAAKAERVAAQQARHAKMAAEKAAK